MKRFFVVLVVFAITMLVTEAQIAPTPAPAPSTFATSDAATAMPAVGVAASVIMLLFGYLF